MKTIDKQDTIDLKLFNRELLKDPKVVDNIETWIHALRSGVYSQGTEYLECDGRYCCLGVANKVLNIGLHGLEPHLEQSEYECDQGVKCYIDTPHMVVGLLSSFGQFDGSSLVELNDDYAWSFEEIADLLENQLEVVSGEIKQEV